MFYSKERDLMKKQIVALGGCGLSVKNLKFEKYLLGLTKKKNPRVCFLPQASCEDRDYIVRFYEVYTQLNAKPSWVSLLGKVEDGWQEKLLLQDVIFVGGGNTRSMLALWREWGVDHVLRQAYEKGIILAGVSAGAICWFEQGVTDSVLPLGILDGLGFLAGSCCPHYDSELQRRPIFQSRTRSKEIVAGIALDDYTAAHFIDGELHRIIAVQPGQNAYRVVDGKDELLAVDLLK